jgi:aminoglycoside 6'-N-acetyltransferase I
MIREINTSDRVQLVNLINSVDEFNQQEKEVAIELVDDALNNSESTYKIFAYTNSEIIEGYYCIGKRALTDGVHDLYWIAVKPDCQSKGIGKQLIDHAEEYVEKNNGSWLLIETSSKDNYEKTRSFYIRNFYTIVAEIKDFYRKGDDLIIFGKYLKS